MGLMPSENQTLCSERSTFPHQKSQWQQPVGVLELLLLVGGEVVQHAIAQQVGSPFNINPVAFSFGWVGYSVRALLSTIGDGTLMPCTDVPSMVVNASNGYHKANRSWVLGRVLRDWEYRSRYRHSDYALVAIIFRVVEGRGKKAGIPRLDAIWYGGVAVIVVQALVAAIPGILRGDWLILTFTAGGTVLALWSSALPQWKAEKWWCRRLGDQTANNGLSEHKTIVLTRGNGSRTVIIIHTAGSGLNLEDLATQSYRNRNSWPVLLLLASLWLVLLLGVSNLWQDSWYLLAVGCLGMAQNLFVASYHRNASAFGIHLSEPEYVVPDPEEAGMEKKNKVFKVLMKLEHTMKQKYEVPRVGVNLLPVFFPNDNLRPQERQWRNEKETFYRDEESLRRARQQTAPMLVTHRLDRSISAPGAVSHSTQTADPLVRRNAIPRRLPRFSFESLGRENTIDV